jgi:hypothetical protein
VHGLGFDAAGRLCVVGGAGPYAQHSGLFDATFKIRATVA